MDFTNELAGKMNAIILRRTIDELSEPDHTIFLQRYFYYEPINKIAKELGLTYKSVESRLSRGKVKLKKMFLALASILCFSLVTAFAADYFQADHQLAEYLDASPELRMALDSEVSKPLDLTRRSHGTTIHLRKVFGDQYLTYMLMDVTAPKGVIFEPDTRYRMGKYIHFTDGRFGWDGSTNVRVSSSIARQLKAPGSKPNETSFLLKMSTEKSQVGSYAHLKIEGIEGRRFHEETMQEIVPGTWKFCFKLDYKDSLKSIL